MESEKVAPASPSQPPVTSPVNVNFYLKEKEEEEEEEKEEKDEYSKADRQKHLISLLESLGAVKVRAAAAAEREREKVESRRLWWMIAEMVCALALVATLFIVLGLGWGCGGHGGATSCPTPNLCPTSTPCPTATQDQTWGWTSCLGVAVASFSFNVVHLLLPPQSPTPLPGRVKETMSERFPAAAAAAAKV